MFHCTVTCFTAHDMQLAAVTKCAPMYSETCHCTLVPVTKCAPMYSETGHCTLVPVTKCAPMYSETWHVTVHWCTFGNSCKLHDVGWTACFFMYLRRCLLYVLASTLLQSQEGSFCLFIWNVVRFCVSVCERERERVCVCVCTLMGGCLMSFTGLEFQLCPSIPLFYLASLLFCPVQLLSISLSSPYSAVGPVVPSAFLKCLTVSFER